RNTCMALTTRELPRGEWTQFFNDFSRDLDLPSVTVEVAGREIGAQVEADGLRLTGITYDRKDDILVVDLDAKGGMTEELEHIVYQPQKIYLASDDAGPAVFDVAA